MPKFFCEEKDEKNLYITGEDAKHISRVLRMKEGDPLCACMDGYDYEGTITSLEDGRVTIRVTGQKPNKSEPSANVTLYQALPKGEKFDLIVQKAVELGVTRIVPVLTKRCVSRPDQKAMDKKRIRWQRIAKEAAKQSGRGIIPQIDPIISYREALEKLSGHETALLFYEGGGQRINHILQPNCQDIGLLIGSEGGFESSEIEQAVQMEIPRATLGRLILRCETAPLAALAIIMNLTQNI